MLNTFLYVISVSCQLAGAETLLVAFFTHFGLSETYDDIHKDDGDYGDEDNDGEQKKRQCMEKTEVLVARLTAIYLFFGYVLSIMADKPQNVSVTILVLMMVVLSVILMIPVVCLYHR